MPPSSIYLLTSAPIFLCQFHCHVGPLPHLVVTLNVLATNLHWICHTIILATNLCRICNTILFTTDPGKVCDTIIACANLGQICHRAISSTDLGELYCKSHNLPNSSIPVLPSYDLMGLPASCTSRPMTSGWKRRPKSLGYQC